MIEKNQRQQISVIPSSEASGVDLLSQAMSQVSIKVLEITGSIKQNQDLVDMAKHKEKVRKALEYHCKELEEKNNKLTKKFSSRVTLQG